MSSTRRSAKTLAEFNTIFKNRGILQQIKGYLPTNQNELNRGEEINNFVNENNLNLFLILDDDKTLNTYQKEFEANLVLTQYYQGLNNIKLSQAIKLAVELLT